MNPTALITGASRGIGRAIALALAKEKFNCVINYASNKAAANEMVEEGKKLGVSAIAVKANIASSSDRKRLVDETLKAFSRIDILVNNAGVAPEKRADLLEATEESFDRLIATNLKGPYFLTQLVAQQMLKQQPIRNPKAEIRNPKIITVSSISAYAASVNRGDYCISKAGLTMMTKLYAARLAESNIQVFELRPGIIETDMTAGMKEKYDTLINDKDLTPIKRWGIPDDVGKAVAAIAKDLLPFSTGEIINIDGGFHLRRL